MPVLPSGSACLLKIQPRSNSGLDANYLSAELNYNNKNSKAALPFYETVAARAPNKYAERSGLQVARIYYFEMKDYANAEKYFAQAKVISAQQENKLAIGVLRSTVLFLIC